MSVISILHHHLMSLFIRSSKIISFSSSFHSQHSKKVFQKKNLNNKSELKEKKKKSSIFFEIFINFYYILTIIEHKKKTFRVHSEILYTWNWKLETNKGVDTQKIDSVDIYDPHKKMVWLDGLLETMSLNALFFGLSVD